MFKPVLGKWAGKTDEEATEAAEQHQEELGRYIVTNTPMPNTPGNEAGKWSSLADIPTGNAWSNF
jgi:hypothetical protein